VVEGEFDRRRTLRWVAPVVALLLVSFLFSNALQRYLGNDDLLGEILNRRSGMRTALHQESVRFAVEAYRVKTGAYPETLSALADDGFLPVASLRDGERELWDYAVSPTGEDFVLLATPPRPRSD
jgi:hypothetical protein